MTITGNTEKSWIQKVFGGRQAHEKLFVYGSLTPIMIYMIIFSILPILWAVAMVFFSYSPVRAGNGWLGLGGSNPFIGLDNFKQMFADTQPARLFRSSVGNTFLFSFLVLPINLIISLPLAVMVESVHEKVKGFFRAIYFLPTISSSVAVAMIWGYIYDPQYGLLNSIFRFFSLTPPRAWISDPTATVLGVPLAMLALIIAYIWQDFGYNLVIFIAALQGIPQSIRDAARVDGANSLQEFLHITIPLLRPTILLVSVLTMLSSFQVFAIIQVMTQGGPNNQTSTLVLNIYNNAFKYQNMGWASAISMVLFIIIAIFTVIQFRVLRTEWEY